PVRRSVVVGQTFDVAGMPDGPEVFRPDPASLILRPRKRDPDTSASRFKLGHPPSGGLGLLRCDRCADADRSGGSRDGLVFFSLGPILKKVRVGSDPGRGTTF